MLRVKDLHKSFGDNEVLKGIDENIEKGEVVCVIGPSGSGKSTFLRCLNLLEEPTSGEVYLDDEKINDPNVDINKVRQRLGMVFQNFNLFPHKTVTENITMAPINVLKMSQADAVKRAHELLEMVGLADKADEYPKSLSGGQQQRVAIARAIAAQPPVILADEPTGNLDSASSKEILQILKNMHEQGKTVILITHDNGIAAQARRVVRIIDGKIESDFVNENYGKEEYVKNQLDA